MEEETEAHGQTVLLDKLFERSEATILILFAQDLALQQGFAIKTLG